MLQPGELVSVDVTVNDKRTRVMGIVSSSLQETSKVCIQTTPMVMVEIDSRRLRRVVASWKSTERLSADTVTVRSSKRDAAPAKSDVNKQQNNDIPLHTNPEAVKLRQCLLDPFDVLTGWKEPVLSLAFILCSLITLLCRHWNHFIAVPLVPLLLGSVEHLIDLLFHIAILLVLVAASRANALHGSHSVYWRTLWVLSVVILTAARVVQWRWGKPVWFLEFNLPETIFIVTALIALLRKVLG